MSSVAISGNASGTAVFTIASPATSTNRTLTLPDATGTVLTTATAGVPVNGPAFSAYQSSLQSLSASVTTLIQYQTELFDTNNNFSGNRFTPSVSGYYQISAAVGCSGVASFKLIVLFVNGAEARRGQDASATQTSMSALLYLNGTTDYVEVYIQSGTAANTDNLSNRTWFSGALIRSAL